MYRIFHKKIPFSLISSWCNCLVWIDLTNVANVAIILSANNINFLFL